PAGVALDLRVDADYLAGQVEERSTRVAVIDSRVGLNRVRDREVVRRGHFAMERAHDAGGDRLLEPERTADRDHALADLERARVAEGEWVQQRGGGVHLQDG